MTWNLYRLKPDTDRPPAAWPLYSERIPDGVTEVAVQDPAPLVKPHPPVRKEPLTPRTPREHEAPTPSLVGQIGAAMMRGVGVLTFTFLALYWFLSPDIAVATARGLFEALGEGFGVTVGSWARIFEGVQEAGR